MPSLVKYTSRTFQDIRDDLIAAIPDLAPDLTSHGEDEPFIALLDMLAGVGDALHYYLDKQALENYLPTVVLRKNALRLTHLIGYRPSRAIASEGNITLTAAQPLPFPLFIPKLTQLSTQGGLPIVLLEDANLPLGFSGVLTLNAVQGKLTSNTFTSTGVSPQVFTLSSQAPAEQLFNVTTLDQEWVEFRDSLPEDENGRWYHYREDRDGGIQVRFDLALGNVPAVGTDVLVQFLEPSATNIEASTPLRPPIIPKPSDLSTSDSMSFDDAVDLLSFATGTIIGYKPRETVAQMRYRGPQSLKTKQRAVEAEDYEFLAKDIPGVLAVKPVASDFYSREVILHVLSSEISTTPQATLDAVVAYLGARDVLTFHLTAVAASIDEYHLAIEVKPAEGVTDAAATYAVKTRLEDYLNTTALAFGRTLRVGEVYSIANQLPEVKYVNVTAMYLDGDSSGVTDIEPTGAANVPWIASNLIVTPVVEGLEGT